jgi:hypothetical protein
MRVDMVDANLLDPLVPDPDLSEVDHVDVAATPERAWNRARHANLAGSPLLRALFAIRTLPSRLRGREAETASLTIDDIASSDRPGFRLLAESEREVVVGAIGKVWKPDISFVELGGAEAFTGFSEPGFVKVAWALRVRPRGQWARIEVEVRVSATDDASRDRFRRYFRFIGPASRFIRRRVLGALVRELGTPEAADNERPLPGDELLHDAVDQITHGITIRAGAESIWPWLVQMGCRRAGWYSYDFLDNAGVPSAREIHPELQGIALGDVLPATPEGEEGFEVLRIDPPRVLVLGGLYDGDSNRQLPFTSERPERYWHVSWAFVLDELQEGKTRLLVRARAAFPGNGWLHASWIRPVHRFMQSAQLRNLKARVEGRMTRGTGGAALQQG